jgi:hypothetical protein
MRELARKPFRQSGGGPGVEPMAKEYLGDGVHAETRSFEYFTLTQGKDMIHIAYDVWTALQQWVKKNVDMQGQGEAAQEVNDNGK